MLRLLLASSLLLAACAGNPEGLSTAADSGADGGAHDAGSDAGGAAPSDDGGFQLTAAQTYVFTPTPTLLAAGDFNRDGKPDVLLLFGAQYAGDHLIELFLGNGDGTLDSSPAPIDTLHPPRGLALADFNGDGELDAAIGICDDDGSHGAVLFFFGDGKGGFAAPRTFPASVCPFSLAAADLNGDGIADLVTVGPGPFVTAATGGAVQTYLGGATLAAAWGATLSTPGLGVATADLRGPGASDRPELPDLIVARVDGVQILQNQSTLGAAVLDFSGFPPLALAGGPYRVVRAADVDGDGRPDLVLSSVTARNVAVLLNRSRGGTLTLAPELAARVGREPTALALADLRGTGVPQIVAASASALLDGVTVVTLVGDQLSAAGAFTGSSAYGVDAADFNGDGRADLVISDEATQTLSVLLNTRPASPALDAGPFTVGPHAPIPPLPYNGGPVLQNVELFTLSYDGDPLQAQRDAYGDWVVSSAWYADVASEYGPGPGTNHNVHLSGAAPTSRGDSEVQSLIADLIADGGLPPPVPTDGGAPNQLYMIHFPPQTTISSLGLGTSCQSYCGYHSDNGVFSYAVIPSCGSSCGPLGLTVSHELIEASTDPFPMSNSAYSAANAAVSGFVGEVGDLCGFYAWTDGVHVATRSWSNAAAAAGTQPCIPAPAEPFAGVAPPSPAIVQVPVGQSVTLALEGWSTTPAGLFAVGVLPYGNSLVMPQFTPTAAVDAGLLLNGEATSLTIAVPAGAQPHQLGIVNLFAGYVDDNLFTWPLVVEAL